MKKLLLSSNPFLAIPLVVLSITFSFSTVLLLSKNATLQKQSRALSEESKKLQAAIKTLQGENQNLLARNDQEKKALEEAFASLKRENESLQFDLKKTAENLTQAAEEKTYLEEMLINKTKENELLKKGSQLAAVNPGSQELIRQVQIKEDEIKRLNEQNRILSRKIEKLYQTTNEKIAEINVAKITLEETILQARKIIDQEWNTVDLGSISVNQGAAAPAKAKAAEPRKTPKKEGRVLAVNEDHGFVIVDVGRVDGIKSDMTLYLKKNGQSVGSLSVLEVRDVMTACNIKDLPQGKKIEINDLVLMQR